MLHWTLVEERRGSKERAGKRVFTAVAEPSRLSGTHSGVSGNQNAALTRFPVSRLT